MSREYAFRTMRTLLLALAFLPLVALAAPMTNEDVIKMAKSGLSEAIILQSISSAEPKFDTSADGLVKLKQGGVSDKVIQHIMSRKPGAAPTAAAAPACAECGSITSIREITKPGKGTGIGAVAGGVVGGVLGHNVADRHRTAGTLVGAAGGAVAGHLIEQKAREGKVFAIAVKFDDGSTKTYHYESHPSWKTGDRVRREGSALKAI